MEPQETYPPQPARRDEPHLGQGRSTLMEEGTSTTTAESVTAGEACPTGIVAESAQSSTEQSSTEKFGEQSRATGERLREQAGQAAEQVREQAGQAAEKVREQATHAVAQLRESGQQAAEGQKSRVASSLHSVGQAVHEAANRLREEENHNLADYTEKFAQQIDEASSYLEQHQLGEMFDEVQHWARRRPELLLGGMFLGGLALARFLKASRPQRTPSRMASTAPRPMPHGGLPAEQVHAGPPMESETTTPPFTPPGEPYATTTPPESFGESISPSHPK